MEYNYIALMRKEEIIDLFKFGTLLTPSNYEQFDGDIINLSQNKELARKIFKRCNPFEYSVEYYYIHLTPTKRLGKGTDISIYDVKGIYALDENSLEMGLMLSPPIQLLPPLWKDEYVDFQILQAKKDADIGIRNVENIFSVDFASIRKDRKFVFREEREQLELISDVLHGKPVGGEHSIWYYLLRYERHQNYPKDNRGFFLDVLHVFANFSKKAYVDASLASHRLGKAIMEKPVSMKYNDILEFMIFENDTNEKMNAEYRGFLDIALLFLILKSLFQDGLVDGDAYQGKYLEEFVNLLKEHYDEKALNYSLYLLGFMLGRELTYKFAYLYHKLPILKL